MKFVDVWFYLPARDHQPWIDERHVADPTTFEQTVRMSLERFRARYAVHAYYGRWALVSRDRLTRYFDTQEAAEMVAIHCG